MADGIVIAIFLVVTWLATLIGQPRGRKESRQFENRKHPDVPMARFTPGMHIRVTRKSSTADQG